MEDGRKCQRSFAELLSEGISPEKLEIAGEVMGQMMKNMRNFRKSREEKEDFEV